jgi:hypothetical protein
MCCAIEKEMPVRSRLDYSSNWSLTNHPKKVREKAFEYRRKTYRGSSYGRPARQDSPYRFIQSKSATPAMFSPGGAVRVYGQTSDNPYRGTEVRRVHVRGVSLMDALRSDRAKTIEVFSAIIAAAMIFSLTSSFLFGIHIINPIPALLILVSFAGFFVMAKFASS